MSNSNSPKVSLKVYVQYTNARRTHIDGLILVAKTKVCPPSGFRVIARCSIDQGPPAGQARVYQYNEFATAGTENRFFQPARPADTSFGRPDLGCVNVDFLHRYCRPLSDDTAFPQDMRLAGQTFTQMYAASQDPDAPRMVTPADEPGRVVSFG